MVQVNQVYIYVMSDVTANGLLNEDSDETMEQKINPGAISIDISKLDSMRQSNNDGSASEKGTGSDSSDSDRKGSLGEKDSRRIDLPGPSLLASLPGAGALRVASLTGAGSSLHCTEREDVELDEMESGRKQPFIKHDKQQRRDQQQDKPQNTTPRRCIIDTNKGTSTWNYQTMLLLKKIGEKSIGYKWMHEKDYEHYDNKDGFYQRIEIILLAIIDVLASGGFVAFVSATDINNNRVAAIVILAIGLLLAIFLSIAKGLREKGEYPQKMFNNKWSALKFSEMYYSIQGQFTVPETKRVDGSQFLHEITKQFNDLMFTSQSIRKETVDAYLEATENSDIYKPILVGNMDQIEIVIEDSVFMGQQNQDRQQQPQQQQPQQQQQEQAYSKQRQFRRASSKGGNIRINVNGPQTRNKLKESGSESPNRFQTNDDNEYGSYGSYGSDDSKYRYEFERWITAL